MIQELNDETRQTWQEHPWAVRGGIGVAGLLGVFLLLAGISSLRDAFQSDYFFRVGKGGISVRVPQGISLRHFGLVSDVLSLEAAWEDIERLNIVQVKRFGSLSRTAGNIGGEARITLRGGRTTTFSLDNFSQPAWLIHQRINETTDMVPAVLGDETEAAAEVYG
jgi:hypothetical protein